MSTHWCVVNTLPHQEGRAEANLLHQGYRAWLPVMNRSRRHARRIDTIRVPVFPGYLFVELDLEREAWGRINGTRGVRRLLAQGTRPQILPTAFVTALRQGLTEDGACTLALANLNPLDPGARIRIVSGPLVGCVAVVRDLAPGDRVKLLLEVLGGAVDVTMPRHAVVPAA